MGRPQQPYSGTVTAKPACSSTSVAARATSGVLKLLKVSGNSATARPDGTRSSPRRRAQAGKGLPLNAGRVRRALMPANRSRRRLTGAGATSRLRSGSRCRS